VKFATEQQPGWFAERSERLRAWFQQLFPSTAPTVKPDAAVTARNTTRRAPVEVVSSEAEAAASSSASGAAAGSAAASEEARALPPLLTAPGAASGAAVLNEPVHGEARGAGTAASAPTPTPDDVMPPDAVSVEGQPSGAGGSE
jgi:penicillin-binding protein 1A